MKIVVCIKQVPGSSNVNVDPITGVLIRDGVDSKINPYDLYALETALKLKEDTDGKITALTMGPPMAKEIIKEAYMMGVDEGFLLSDRKFAGADVLATSYAISQGVRTIKDYDLIICGKQTTDGDTAQVGPELAEFLDIPHVANVRKIIKVKDKSIVVEMDLDHTIEIQEIDFPCLITVEKGIYTPRLPSYKMKLETLNRNIPIFDISHMEDQREDYYGLKGSPTQVERIFSPDKNDSKIIWNGTNEELIEKLSNRLKELKFI
ncbi:MAG: electron transfer flavoprotein subunit beta/FixA family protein [Cetobacterium sp.]